MEPVLEAEGISKRFPGVQALDGVSFAVLPGEVHALVGENGAGKSTLVKILTGAYRPDSGELRYLGRPVSFSSPLEARAAGIAAVHQEVNLVPMLSVGRNLLLGREPRNRLGIIKLRKLYETAARQLAEYGIRTDVRRQLRTLGVGVQQMVALARAVSVDGRVVILDEPTSSLHPREVRTLFGVIEGLRRTGVAVIYVSHRLEELYQICDRVTVLRDGRVAHTGPLGGLDRLELVSLMLGRDTSEVRNTGTTRFSRRLRSPQNRPGEPPVLQASRLRRRRLLHDVSLQVHAGEVVGLGGLLGSGRTETVRAMVGALPLDAGQVTVAGFPLRRRTPAAAIRAGLSLLPEDRKADGIVPSLSVRENIALAALPRLSRAGLVSEQRIDQIVETFIKRLRIKAASPHQKVAELSGGNQQKVLLARWLALHPKALLLDEPTRGIDVGAKEEVQLLVEELAEAGLGIVLVSSDLDELVEGSDRVVVLRDGAVVGELHGDDVTEEKIMAAIAGHDASRHDDE